MFLLTLINVRNVFMYVGAEASPIRTTSMSPTLDKFHEHEEDHGHHLRKSVLSKVKERAKKWKRSLSIKKKHGDDGNNTPSLGVISLEEHGHEHEHGHELEHAHEHEHEHAHEHGHDHEEEEEDAIYLGAPSNFI